MTSEQAWSETLHELKRHARVIAERRGLLPEEQEALLVGSVATLEACLQIMPTEAYASLEATACARIPADPNDWPTVALALALGTGVWTQDRDFFGSGLATWSTPVLYHHLMVEQS